MFFLALGSILIFRPVCGSRGIGGDGAVYFNDRCEHQVLTVNIIPIDTFSNELLAHYEG